MATGTDHQVSVQLMRLDRFVALLDNLYQSSIAEYQFSVRLAFLFASLLRVTQVARSIQLLARESYNEEIASITKPLIEIVVNAAYLQYADDIEIDRYLHSDPFFVSEEIDSLRLQLSAGPIPRSARTLKDNAVQAIRRIIRREEDPIWSGRTLMQRAEWVDLRSDTPVMRLLVITMHARVRDASLNTFSSIAPHLDLLDSMAHERWESRQRELTERLFGVNLTLMTLSLYLNSFLRLQADEAIETASGTLRSLRE